MIPVIHERRRPFPWLLLALALAAVVALWGPQIAAWIVDAWEAL